MGFVGGVGNIAISTALPPSFCILYCKHPIIYGIHISYIFYACLRLCFPEVETNPGPRRPVPTVCRLLWSNVLAGNLSNLTLASSQYDIRLCSETLVSDIRHVSELLVPGFWSPCLIVPGKDALPRPEGWQHTYEMDMEHFANPSLSVVVAKCCFLVFVV